MLVASVATDINIRLQKLLRSDLNFHHEVSSELSHNFHSFPAKFPPQLPRMFIRELTGTGDSVLDPMMGSGTTLVEACVGNRSGIGFDIDPLAVLLTQVKLTPLASAAQVAQRGLDIADRAEKSLLQNRILVESDLKSRFDEKTREFVDYWFSDQTQMELTSLIREIEQVPDNRLKLFLQLTFSAIIITKSGGVSLAWDLAHTRPHKFIKGVAKTYRPAFGEFKKRILKNSASLEHLNKLRTKASVEFGNAEKLSLKDNSIDLVFTSPPYPSNAIDYMRAHKFSLVWFGHKIDDLANLRSRYIGGEKTSGYEFLALPAKTTQIITRIAEVDVKKSDAVKRYYSEMKRVLAESFRVLRPGKAAILVVGSSVMRGIDTQVHNCLAELGLEVGFDYAGVATRQIDRNRRMLPASAIKAANSQIETRMHEEFVVAFLKPTK
ncbi:MAG: DNA methyltransferase [Acidobacteriota bacterium]|nr:DNA methyltransferase [Acidobacteriota bacterium]